MRDRPLVLAAAVLVLPAAAQAHKLQLYAEAEGKTIRGEAYYSGGGRPKNVEVVVRGPDGKELGRTRTDGEGRFTFQASVRCDHRLVVDSGDGHMVECTVEADELPADLPAPPGTARASPLSASAPAVATGEREGPRLAAPSPTSSAPATSAGAGASPASPAAPADTVALQRVVSRAVRKELDAYEERVRVRDVIAGIGYIFGVLGVVALVKRRGGPARPRDGR